MSIQSILVLARLLTPLDHLAIWGCTLVVSLLSFTGPAYMLLLYADALPDRDAHRLLQLTAAMLALYGAAGCIDAARQQVFMRRARAIDENVMALSARQLPPMQELDRLRSFMIGPAPAAMCDLPFLPLYLGALYWLHPWLAGLGLCAAVAIALCWLPGQRSSAHDEATARALAEQRASLAARLSDGSHDGEQTRIAQSRALKIVHHRLRAMQEHGQHPGPWRMATLRALRPALQTTMLGLAAYLAATEACHPAVILIAAVLLPRVIGPVETTLAQRGIDAPIGAIALHADYITGARRIHTLNSSIVVNAMRRASDQEADRLRKYSSS